MGLQERGVESNIEEPVIEALNERWRQSQEHHDCCDSREPKTSDQRQLDLPFDDSQSSRIVAATVLYLTPCNPGRLDGHRRPSEETDEIDPDGRDVGHRRQQGGDG